MPQSILVFDGRNVTFDGVLVDSAACNQYLKARLGGDSHSLMITLEGTLDAARAEAPETITISNERDFGFLGGQLTVADLEIPTPFGFRTLTWVGWQCNRGLVRTSFRDGDQAYAIERFSELGLEERSNGIVVEGEFDESERPPQLLRYQPDLGILNVMPRSSPQTDKYVPANGGKLVTGGNLYRISSQGEPPTYMLVGESTIMSVTATESVVPSEAEQVLERAAVAWAA